MSKKYRQDEKRALPDQSSASGTGGPYGYEQEEEGISLKELLLVLIKGKKVIAVTTVILILVTLVGSVLAETMTLGTKGTVQTAVQLYFDGIQNGMTPDGRPYDINEMKSAEILQRAVDQVSMSAKPSISELSSCISFQAVLPDDAAKTLQNLSEIKTEELKLERLEGLKINPDTYIVTLNVANGLGITKEEGRELLDSVAGEYKKWLVEKYAGFTVLADVFAGDFSLEDYDYIQIADLMSSQVNSLEQYVQNNMQENDGSGEFSSSATGLSKEDLLNAIEAVGSNEVEMLYAKIAGAYASKDLRKSAAVYEKLAEDKEREYAQKNEEALSLYGLIQQYKKGKQTLVLGENLESTYDLQTQNPDYDKLVTKYIAAGQLAADAQADAAYYREEAQRFQGAPTVSGPETDAGKEIQTILDRAKETLSYWTKMANRTVEDYYREATYQKYTEQLIPALDYNEASNLNLLLNLAIGLVAGLILGILIVLFREYMKEEKREKQGVTGNEAH